MPLALRLLTRSQAIASPWYRPQAVAQLVSRPLFHHRGGGGGRAARQQAACSPSPPRMTVAAPYSVAMPLDSAQQHPKKQQQHKRRPPLWWKERPSYCCPACGQQCFRVPAFEAHLFRCCPDVAPPEEWRQLMDASERQQQQEQQQAAAPLADVNTSAIAGRAEQQTAASEQQQVQGEQEQQTQQQAGEQQQQTAAVPALPVHHADSAIRAWLAEVEGREAVQREKALDIAFRQTDGSGDPVRHGSAEVGKQLGLPEARAERLLRAAMKAVPLAADCGHAVEVLYEDEDLVAVNKPAGLITAPKHRYVGGSMVNRIIGTLGFEPLTLHRLDMNTTGVVLFAKKRDIVDGVHSQFRAKSVRKEYLALAVGVPSQAAFTIDAAIERDENDVVARRVVQGGKPALTDFTVLAASPSAALAHQATAGSCSAPALMAALDGGGLSLVSCRPQTGRTHQIRVHLAHAGHAILGDDLYGATGPWIARHALHAAALTIRHPRSGQPLTVRAPLPPDFLAAMEQLGLPLHEAQQAEQGAAER